MIQIMKVTGESLSPFFQYGDFVLVIGCNSLIRRLKPGDVVVFCHPDYGKLIKVIESLSSSGEELFVVGSHPESTDSRTFGSVPRAWVIGKVIFHIGGYTQPHRKISKRLPR
jgi:nickel-type superoxide dismutase maturation protease